MVTMTEDEQQVFAWMGVSPVVLSDPPAERPKTAIVAVVLPGEDPPENFLPTKTEPSAEESSNASNGSAGDRADSAPVIAADSAPAESLVDSPMEEENPEQESRTHVAPPITKAPRGRGRSSSGRGRSRGGVTQTNGTPQLRHRTQALPAQTVSLRKWRRRWDSQRSPNQMGRYLPWQRRLYRPPPAPVADVSEAELPVESTADLSGQEPSPEPVAAGETVPGRRRRRRRSSTAE